MRFKKIFKLRDNSVPFFLGRHTTNLYQCTNGMSNDVQQKTNLIYIIKCMCIIRRGVHINYYRHILSYIHAKAWSKKIVQDTFANFPLKTESATFQNAGMWCVSTAVNLRIYLPLRASTSSPVKSTATESTRRLLFPKARASDWN